MSATYRFIVCKSSWCYKYKLKKNVDAVVHVVGVEDTNV